MRYVMLIMNTESARALSMADDEAWRAEIVSWYEKYGASGKLVEVGHELQPPTTAKTVRANGVTDGPFMETKEVLGGYSVLDTETLDEAVDIARTWPGVDRGWITIEIRQPVEM